MIKIIVSEAPYHASNCPFFKNGECIISPNNQCNLDYEDSIICEFLKIEGEVE